MHQKSVEERARTGQLDTPNAIAKFVVIAQRNKKIKASGLSDDVLKSFVPLSHHNELSLHSRSSHSRLYLGFSQRSVINNAQMFGHVTQLRYYLFIFCILRLKWCRDMGQKLRYGRPCTRELPGTYNWLAQSHIASISSEFYWLSHAGTIL